MEQHQIEEGLEIYNLEPILIDEISEKYDPLRFIIFVKNTFEQAGYNIATLSLKSYTMQFTRGKNRINFFWNKRACLNLSSQSFKNNLYTVQTMLPHPKYKSIRQLTRKGLSWDEVVQIIQNPRKHTGKGYYKKT